MMVEALKGPGPWSVAELKKHNVLYTVLYCTLKCRKVIVIPSEVWMRVGLSEVSTRLRMNNRYILV